MSLDDIISKSKANRKRGGAVRRDRKPKPAPYSVPKAKPITSEKITVSNLAYSVTESDVRELFSQIGPLKQCSLNYNAEGKSKGVAHVVFQKAGDGTKAVKEYNNRTFDGRPMKIEMVLAADAIPTVTAANRLGAPVKRDDAGAKRGRGAGRGRGRGGKRGGPSKKPATAADLDAELDGYMNDQDMDDAEAAASAELATAL